MAINFVNFQQQVGEMGRNKEGNYVGLAFYPTEAIVTGEDLKIAKPVFYKLATGLDRVYASGELFAGLMPVLNENTWSWADTAEGLCMAIQAGRNYGVANKGKFTIKLDKCFAGDAKFGDAVYAHKTNQTWAVGVTTQTDYIKTDFVVILGGAESTEVDICNTLPVFSGVTK